MIVTLTFASNDPVHIDETWDITVDARGAFTATAEFPTAFIARDAIGEAIPTRAKWIESATQQVNAEQ